MKFTSIEEAQDVSIIKVDELIDSILTFEMKINEKHEKNNKSVSFKFDVEEDENHVEEDIDDNLTKSITLLAKIFGKVLSRLDKRSRNNVMNNVKYILPQNSKCFNLQRIMGV